VRAQALTPWKEVKTMLTLFIIAMILDLRSLDKQIKVNEAEIKSMNELIHGRN
jgi:hypothetical protein